MQNTTKKKSFKRRLISAFIITSIIPIIFVIFFSYYNNSKIVHENFEELTITNLQQTRSSLNVWLESYEDILYQIYTDDGIVSLIDKINSGNNIAVSRNQVRRILNELFYTKEYIKSITIIPDKGDVIFYDQLSPSNTENTWLKTFKKTKEQLYGEITATNKTRIISTQYASTFARKDYYLFHLAHRIIDYKNVDRHIGIVVLSIDEALLRNVCTSAEAGSSNTANSFNFIVDWDGFIVSYIDSSHLSERLFEGELTPEQRKQVYQQFLVNNQVFDGKRPSVYVSGDEKLNWDIINVSNQSKVIERLNAQQQLMIVTILISLLSVIIIIVFLTKNLTGSIEKVIDVMKMTGKGKLSVRIEADEKMPVEIETIAVHFNNMLSRLEDSIVNEALANEKQRKAEITALEAQINPHFLYNTLDTINWMAIDHDDFEVSNAINALAKILRYGIDNSSDIVTVQEESEWLKQYIFLQQTRLNNSFTCEIDIEPEVLKYKIHKLLLQPFVENAIVHGFSGVSKEYKLTIEMKSHNGDIHIHISDNGKGMEESFVQALNSGKFQSTDKKGHIGIGNAINRIYMYYGNQAKVNFKSIPGKGTEITIIIPLEE